MGKVNDWISCRTVGEAFDRIPNLDEYRLSLPDKSIRNVAIGEVLRDLIEEEPETRCRLSPGLLIRHASGTLYQEAHLKIARGLPSFFPEMMSHPTSLGPTRRDTHYTPPEFARVLVERSFHALSETGKYPKILEIIDPACGSGVFLQESVRHLEEVDYDGTVMLTGFDISPVSCAVAEFCLAITKKELGSKFSIEANIRETDALSVDVACPPKAGPVLMGIVQLAESQGAIHAKTTDY